MEPINNPFLSEYIKKLGNLTEQVKLLLNALNNSGMEGVQVSKSIATLGYLLSDLEQHKACIEDYSIYFAGVLYDDMD